MDDLTVQVRELFVGRLDAVLLDISKQYDLDYDELKAKYLVTDKKKKGSKKAASAIGAGPSDEEKKPRGRKKKQKDDYIEAEEYQYGGVTYLVDGKNSVYSNDLEAPRLVGERLVDGTIRFYEEDRDA